MIRRALIVLLMLFFFSSLAYADLWEDERDKTFVESYNHGCQDYDGYTYRGGVGYNLPYRKTPPNLGYMYDMGLGCEGFDLNTSFLDNLNAEALKNYATGMAGNALASAPMLLLEYVSPTMADTLKHFKSMSQNLLNLQYRQCEDFQKMGEDWIAKKRGKAKASQMKEAQKEGLSLPEAIEKVKNTPPLEGLKDYNGNLLGTMKLVEDGFKWAKAEEEMTELAPALVGEVVVTAPDKMEYIPATKEKNKLFQENQKEYKKNLETTLKNYDSTKKVSKSDLEKLSLPSVNITPVVIKSIGNMPDYKRFNASAKLVGALALDKTVYQMDSITGTLEQIARHPELTEEDTNVLLQKADTLRKQKQDLIATHKMENTMVARVAGGIVGEYEKDKRNAITEIVDNSDDVEYNDSLVSPWGYGGIK